MSWQGSPLPVTQDHKFILPECPAISGNASNVKTLSAGEEGFVPISPNVCNLGSVQEDVVAVEGGEGGSRKSVYV